MSSGITDQIGDDVLIEDPEGLESETERLYLGFGGLSMQEDQVLSEDELPKTSPESLTMDEVIKA